MFLYCWFQRCRLASSRQGVRLSISYVLATSDRVKDCLFSAPVEAEARSNFSFEQDGFFSEHASLPLSVKGFWEFLYFFKTYFIFIFIFLITTRSPLNSNFLPDTSCNFSVCQFRFTNFLSKCFHWWLKDHSRCRIDNKRYSF